MAKYYIAIPVVASVVVEVEDDNEESAIEQAMQVEFGLSVDIDTVSIYDCDIYRGCINEVEVVGIE